MKIKSILAITALGVCSLAATAHAQQLATLQPVQWGYHDNDRHDQGEYNHGYRDGSHSGRDDARKGRGFSLYDHGSYRDHRDPNYREGYERGYRDAYRAERSNRYYDHDDRWYWDHR